MDTLLTFFLAGSFYFMLVWIRSRHLKAALTAGVFWGLALLTKTSAVYFGLIRPGVFALVFLTSRSRVERLKATAQFVIAGMTGMMMLLVLKASPLFPFLFQRSSDFAFTPQNF
jgi:4-amino-4-deoxy-L-arabinose transferase-like glycosyltransferase